MGETPMLQSLKGLICDCAKEPPESEGNAVTQWSRHMPSGRGILYIKWGTKADAAIQRSLESVRAIHPELPIHVVDLPQNASLLDKALMLDVSPFEETLYLDVDTVVLDRLDFGFAKAVQFGLACCICECPWARRYAGLSGDLIEYNTGVLFFTRQMKPLFDTWKTNVLKLDSSITFRAGPTELGRMPLNDQGGFAQAIAELGINPHVLPMNWNFRPIWQKSFFGPVKIWHDYKPLPAGLEQLSQKQAGEQKLIEFTRIG
jgi:hypothetical protein